MPPPMFNPPVPLTFTAGRRAALASSTYCAACSTLVAATRKSGLFVIASAASASSWASPKVASQLSWMVLVETGAAFHAFVRTRLVSVPDCW